MSSSFVHDLLSNTVSTGKIDALLPGGVINIGSGNTGNVNIASTSGKLQFTTSDTTATAFAVTASLGGATVTTGTNGINLTTTGALRITTGNTGIILAGAAAVTQITSIVTGVTVSGGNSGVITTFSAVTAAATTSVFTVTHPRCALTSVIIVNISDYAGTTGLPSVSVDNILAGTFDIVIQNNHSAAALNGVLKIAFFILN